MVTLKGIEFTEKDLEKARRKIIKNSTVMPNGCWEIRYFKQWSGYSNINLKNVKFRAHRASWTAFKGQIPDGLLVLHRCDNRMCVNPDHLWLGDNFDNMQDCAKKNRTYCYFKTASRDEMLRFASIGGKAMQLKARLKKAGFAVGEVGNA